MWRCLAYAVDQGVDAEKIIMEQKSVSTEENLMFSKELIDNENAKIIIVTTAYQHRVMPYKKIRMFFRIFKRPYEIKGTVPVILLQCFIEKPDTAAVFCSAGDLKENGLVFDRRSEPVKPVSYTGFF